MSVCKVYVHFLISCLNETTFQIISHIFSAINFMKIIKYRSEYVFTSVSLNFLSHVAVLQIQWVDMFYGWIIQTQKDKTFYILTPVHLKYSVV
jgi:hypothetical protein